MLILVYQRNEVKFLDIVILLTQNIVDVTIKMRRGERYKLIQ